MIDAIPLAAATVAKRMKSPLSPVASRGFFSILARLLSVMNRMMLNLLTAALLLVSVHASGATRAEMLDWMRNGDTSHFSTIVKNYPSVWKGDLQSWNHDKDFLGLAPHYVEALATAGMQEEAKRFQDFTIEQFVTHDKYDADRKINYLRSASPTPSWRDPEYEGTGMYRRILQGRYIHKSFRATMASMDAAIEVGERKAKEEALRQAKEAERIAHEKAEAERKAREEAEKAKAESQRKEKERLAKAKDRIERAKQPLSEKVRDFIVLQRPDIWKQYMALSAAIEDQRKSIDAIATAFREFGRDPENDAKFVEEKNKLLEFEILRGEVREIMETAYLKDVIFRHASGNKNYKATVDNAEVGISELSAISEQFNELMQKK